MSNGPGKVVVPSDVNAFGDWQDFHQEGEESHFEYSDNTKDHIMDGKTQHFKYGQNPIPDKM